MTVGYWNAAMGLKGRWGTPPRQGSQEICPHCGTVQRTYLMNERADPHMRPNEPRFVAHKNGNMNCEGSHKIVGERAEKTCA